LVHPNTPDQFNRRLQFQNAWIARVGNETELPLSGSFL
jgi:hypothetical protein